MSDSIEKLVERMNGDYYYMGAECVRLMSEDEDARLIVSGVLRGLLDMGFADELIAIGEGENAYNKIFKTGKK